MEGKKTFIGYDLGDGESITDLAVLDAGQLRDRVQTLFTAMTMPDSNTPGHAIPTVFGYDEAGNISFSSSILADPESVRDIRINFKRRPTDLLPADITPQRLEEIVALVKEGWPDAQTCPELHTPGMIAFGNAAVTFTNALFEDEKYKTTVHDAAMDSEGIIFCIGHPTKWNEADVALYKAILACSVLGRGEYAGLPTEMVMAAESRAAFLYVRDRATSQVLAPGTSALLIDVGSSTIDLTAMTADSRNHQYNSGSNYLGARSVDLIIRELYLNRLRKDEEDWSVYEALISANPAMEQALTLSCRMAKESLFSTTAGMARIQFGDFRPMRITRADVENAVGEMPVAPILRTYMEVPDEVVSEMGGCNWLELFRYFLQDKKREIEARGIVISRIILTGSASKMPFVPAIVAEVFDGLGPDAILSDLNPSRSISMGLALVGPSNEKSKNFQKDLSLMLEEEIPAVIEGDMPQLAEGISQALTQRVNAIVLERMRQWRSGDIRTLQEMTELIKEDCSQEKLADLLLEDEEYNAAVQHWAVEVVGQDIALKLQSLCRQYGVNDVTLENLNALKASSIQLGAIRMNPTEDIANVLSATISIIAGVIVAAILPTLIGVIVGLIMVVAYGLGALLLNILLAIPGIGWAVLLGVAGFTVVKLAATGLESAKKQLADKIQTLDLPAWVRDRMTDEKLTKQIEKADLQAQIRASVLEEESRARIVESVTKSLRKQVEKRAEDIKYVIESK